MKKIKVALVKGDGIGPETMAPACAAAIEAAKLDEVEIDFEETPMGWNAWEKYGDTFPQESLKRVIKLGILFFGGVGDPEFDNTIGIERPEMKPEARALLGIRKAMELLINLRPVIYRKELAHLARHKPEMIPDEGIKQIFIRFLLEDSYFGNIDFFNRIPEDVKSMLGIKLKGDITGKEAIVTDIAYYRRETIEKYFRVVFQYARDMDLPVISVDKANVMARYEFWRKIAKEIGENEFPDVSLVNQLVDSANALLFIPAELHGIIPCGNEHGDILSDGGIAAAGSMGMMYSSAINPDTGAAMFESGAGTAPTLAGKDVANPLGRILAGAEMLEHIGAPNGADAIRKAVNQILKEGYRTRDLYQEGIDDPSKLLGTSGMGELVLSNL